MTTLFDLPAGQALKERGMAQAATGRAELLATAQSIARNIALAQGKVTSDDVRRTMGLEYRDLGPAAGLIFRKGFEPVGMVKSKYPGNHAALIGVWRIKNS